MEFRKPYRMGDVVRYTGDPKNWDLDTEMVVESAECSDYHPLDFKYSTTSGAWFRHKDLELVRECDYESLRQLWISARLEEDSNYDDGDEDEEDFEERARNAEATYQTQFMTPDDCEEIEEDEEDDNNEE